ncbi:hypothetical protein BH09ACT6_BH09ACT6_08430 [soil metagenome]
MEHTRRDARTVDDVVFTELSEHEWRVTDRRLDGDNPFALIGFVAQIADRYEIVVYGDPITTMRARSLESAMAVFATASAASDAGVRYGILRILPRWVHSHSGPRRHRASYIEPVDEAHDYTELRASA